MSVRGGSRVQGLVSFVLAVAFWGGCSSSPPGRPDGGATGGDAATGGTTGKGGATGSAGSGGGSGGGVAGAGGSGAGGNHGAAGASEAGTTGAAGGSAGSTAGADGTTAGTGGGAAGGKGGSAGGAAATTGGAGGNAGAGGSPSACGDLGDACCAGGTCNGGLACLNGATCTCAQALFGRYILRTDGSLLYEDDASGAQGAQTPVLNASTGMPLPGIKNVVEGWQHGCALLTDKTVWCWRSSAQGNSAGELGSGTIDASGPIFRATQVLTGANQPLTGVTALSSLDAANSTQSCAITGAAANVYCWGDISWVLNGGTTLQSPYATEVTLDGVTPLTGALQMTTDGWVACSILQGATSNEAWCWGLNGSGNLGTGDMTTHQYPTKVVGFSSPTQIVPFGHYDSTYGSHFTTCVIDGADVRCWGENGGGEVGNGTTNSPVLSPALVTLMGGTTALTGIVDLRGTASAWNISEYICGLAADHTVKCWGQGFAAYPQNYNVTNVVTIGNLDQSIVRLLTSDGLYHIGSTTRAPNCGLLQ